MACWGELTMSGPEAAGGGGLGGARLSVSVKPPVQPSGTLQALDCARLESADHPVAVHSTPPQGGPRRGRQSTPGRRARLWGKARGFPPLTDFLPRLPSDAMGT